VVYRGGVLAVSRRSRAYDVHCGWHSAIVNFPLLLYAEDTRSTRLSPCVLQLYQQLIKSGQLTSGEVQSTEMLAEAQYRISYQFTLPTSGQSIIGQYVTDRQFPAGTRMAVIYLDANCHALL
jgi:hypothetical protein